MILPEQHTPSHSYSRAYPQAKWRKTPSKAPAAPCLVLLTATLLAAALGSRVLLLGAKPPVRYVLVIDSGSSGTRMYAYNWTQPLDSSSGRTPTKTSSRGGQHSNSGQASTSDFPVVRPIPPSAAPHLLPKHARKGMYNRVETRPGLDAFTGDSAGLAGALGPLLAWARAVVPAGQHPSTPLFLMGTGGFRRLPAAGQQQLLDQIRTQLGQSGFRFEPSWARVISGDDEGAFGWLALNYQLGRLRPHAAAAAAAGAAATSAAPDSASLTSLGALDLGGSSLQITFEVLPPTSTTTSSSNGNSSSIIGQVPAPTTAGAAVQPQYNVTVAGHTFQLHLHSFKQYGLNEAYDRTITVLLQQQQQQKLEAPSTTQQLVVGVVKAADLVGAAGSSIGNSSEASSSSLSSSSANAATAAPLHATAAALQHDIAVAHAAGIQAAAEAAGGSSSAPVTPDTEHQRQADLATAAAAGYRPEDTTAPGQVSASSSSSITSRVGDSTVSSSTGNTASSSSSSATGKQLHSNTLLPQLPAAAASAGSGAVAAAAAAPASAVVSVAAASRRASLQLRRHLMQQQLLLLEQLLEPNAGSMRSKHTDPAAATMHSSSSSSSSSAQNEQQHHLSVQDQEQHSHDIRLRQLLREYLLREDPLHAAHAPAATLTANSTSISSISSSSSTSSSSGSHTDSTTNTAAGAAPVAAVGAPHPVVPIHESDISRSGSSRSSSSNSSIGSRQGPEGGVAAHAGDAKGLTDASTTSSSSSSSGPLPVVLHPCLHAGYEAPYTRVAYEGVAPQPPQVLLRGQPDWQSCLAVVHAVVNAHAPCAVQEHLPACVLGTPQPELHGTFMALTGFYVVSRFLGVQGSSSSLDPLLDAAQALCARPWPWVSQHLGSHVNVERYCTWGPYVVKLLLQGLGLPERQVVIAQDGDLGWPLGAALVEASKLPGFSATAAGAAAAAGGRRGASGEGGKGVRGRAGSSSSEGRAGRGTSLRGVGVLHQEQQAKATATAAAAAATPPPAAAAPPPQAASIQGGMATGTQQLQQQQQQQQQQQGPAWSLGLLHHNEASRGLHLSGTGWGAVLLLVWLTALVYCRGLLCGGAGLLRGQGFVGVTLGQLLQPTLTGGLLVGPGRGHGATRGVKGALSRSSSAARLRP